MGFSNEFIFSTHEKNDINLFYFNLIALNNSLKILCNFIGSNTDSKKTITTQSISYKTVSFKYSEKGCKAGHLCNGEIPQTFLIKYKILVTAKNFSIFL